MDKTTRNLAEYVTGLTFAGLSTNAVRETRRHIIDTIACGLGGFHSEPAAIALRVARQVTGRPAARVLGTDVLTTPEMATFVNATMVRYLDYNDTYISLGSGHPSDMVPACLAVAEAYGASGEETLLAIVAAYEVYAALADAIPIRERGWDQGVFAVLGATTGVGKLLGLTSGQLGEALAIAVSSNVPTRQARAGELAMWKGCATAAASRAGVFAALLAREGMTGPTAAFEGKHGIWDQVTGPFELALGRFDGSFGIERTHLKFLPAEFHSQVPFSIAQRLGQQVTPTEVAGLHVETYYMAYSEIGSEPQKWAPQTRETADHSLPYLLALALTDGQITPASFDEARIHDPAMLALMARITIAENPEFTSQFPSAMVSRVDLQTTDGRHLVEQAAYPRGHIKNPMSDEEVEGKLRQLASGLITADAQTALLDTLWRFDEAPSVAALLDLLQVQAPDSS